MRKSEKDAKNWFLFLKKKSPPPPPPMTKTIMSSCKDPLANGKCILLSVGWARAFFKQYYLPSIPRFCRERIEMTFLYTYFVT